LRLAFSDGPKEVGGSHPHLSMERDPNSEMLCSSVLIRILDDGYSPETDIAFALKADFNHLTLRRREMYAGPNNTANFCIYETVRFAVGAQKH
jgi:hypothetical protein